MAKFISGIKTLLKNNQMLFFGSSTYAIISINNRKQKDVEAKRLETAFVDWGNKDE